MTIFNINTHDVATTQCNTYSKPLLPGNIIPHEWYKRFTDDHGNADLVAITILADIVAWYRNSDILTSFYSKSLNSPSFDGNALTLSYDYLSNKFSLGKERIRKALVRLEQDHIISRKVCNVKLTDSRRVNRLVIILDSSFLHSCFRNPQTDIRVEEGDIVLSSTSLENHQSDNSIDNSNFRSTSKRGDHIMNKNNNIFINKNRSNLSIFEKKFLEEKFEKKLNTGTNEAKEKKERKQRSEKKLADFYPLSQEDVSLLQSKSGREFNGNAMNEILQDMAKRLGDRVFASKNAFLNYMSKAFTYEKRQAPVINNETFRIRNNLSEQEVSLAEQEKYLAEIEYSLQVSPEWHLKKKLASVLEQGGAYKLLRAWKGIRISGNIARIYLSREVELSGGEERLILQQVKATHERMNEQTGLVNVITKLELIMPIAGNSNNREEGSKPAEALPDNVWGRVRSELTKQYGVDTDRNWFSRLSAEICEETKQVKLKAPSEFVKDWIEREYMHNFQNYFRLSCYECIIC